MWENQTTVGDAIIFREQDSGSLERKFIVTKEIIEL